MHSAVCYANTKLLLFGQQYVNLSYGCCVIRQHDAYAFDSIETVTKDVQDCMGK